jgi:hypothetical protein
VPVIVAICSIRRASVVQQVHRRLSLRHSDAKGSGRRLKQSLSTSLGRKICMLREFHARRSDQLCERIRYVYAILTISYEVFSMGQLGDGSSCFRDEPQISPKPCIAHEICDLLKI